ncbi:LysR substrate-binding domain-containing protein [Cupriavidus sp. WGtm5]|uniref:LysR substrate-binding domain-containing protein n=1 Tax=Cupriavidus sp. WGtm5 TaxID=2919926 RepID=UPI0020905730|nr:LysR substrate-binding domain-containing protein [Cupriavidus sp. WGtm5]MCO4887906.1 LysR substrate-binding domain-containing protein [Cupriavidus sp. WGtm5]
MRRIPNFVLLRAFEAAARLESFTLAAKELHLTQSAISHQVRELEEYFNRKLFDRRNRRVELTPEGERLLESLSRVFDVIEAACNEVALAPQSEVLAVYCAPSFAVKWLGPRLPKFMQTHGDITIRLSSGAEAIDLTQARELDLAITYGSAHTRAGLVVQPLGQERILPLCSPSIIDAKMSVRAQMETLPLIDSQLSRVTWPDWFGANGLVCPTRPRASFDRGALAISAAVDGMGIALESIRLAERELSKGDLIALGEDEFTHIARETHFLSYRQNEAHLHKVAAFVQWLTDQLDVPFHE